MSIDTSAMNSLSNLLGLHFIVGLSSSSLLPEERSLLRELKPLGIVLFAKNINSTSADWANELNSLIEQTKKLVGRENLLVSIDHEGGRVHRFPQPVTRFPAAKTWQEKAHEVSFAMGTELRYLGFNLSFAPVLDIHTEPLNTVIGDRAHSSDPELVATYAIEAMRGLHEAGILSCGKHFPGHGNTLQDSHHELPVLDTARDVLESREFLPFRRLIAQEIPMIMSAHVRYLGLDGQKTASVSPKILNDLLRGELGFQKVIITDDLEMKAIRNIPARERALRAITAGSDILLEANPSHELALEIALEMKKGLLHAVQEEGLDLSQSQKRISEMLELVKTLKNVPRPKTNVVGCAQHLALAEERKTHVA